MQHVNVSDKQSNVATLILRLSLLRGIGSLTVWPVTMYPTTLRLDAAEAQTLAHDPLPQCRTRSSTTTETIAHRRSQSLWPASRCTEKPQ